MKAPLTFSSPGILPPSLALPLRHRLSDDTWKWRIFSLLSSVLSFGSVLPLVILPLHSFASAENSFGGHLKYQPSLLDYETVFRQSGESSERSGVAHDFDARLNFSSRHTAFSVNAHAEILAAHSAIGFERSSTSLLDDNRQLFDLSASLIRNRDLEMLARFDRFNLKYTAPQAVVTVGREAISWGNGLAFHVLDLFNPFSPIAVDKDYKTGADLALAQLLFDDQSDIQLLVVPRRSLDGSTLRADESSFAAKYRQSFGGVDLDLLGAAHRGELFCGLGSVTEFSEALLRFDASLQREKGDRYFPSMVLNLDRTFVLGGKNLQASLEYFHNGVGLQPDEYSSPSRELLERLLRGEIFTIGRDYLAPMVRVEVLPTVNIHSIFIFHLHDESSLLQLRITHEVVQDMVLLLGSTAPLGGRDSEFGGVSPMATESASAQRQVDSLQWSAYARISVYF